MLLYRVEFLQLSLLAYLALTAVIVAVCQFSDDHAKQRLAGLSFVAATFAIILANRIRIFSYAPSLNADEALFAANAMRSMYGWTNWGLIDPTTSGPLNSMVLTWPYLFGADVTIYSGRLTAALLACGTTGFIYATATRLAKPVWAVLATLPAALFYATTANFEFVHFSSEQLPVFLIAGSIFFVISTAVRPKLFSAALAAFMAGLIPFAKLQGLPWAVLLGVAALASVWLLSDATSPGRARRVRLGAAMIAFGLLPAALFLIPLAVTGDFDDFIKSYFVQQYLRAQFASNASLPGLLQSAPTISALIYATAGVVAVSLGVLGFNRSACAGSMIPHRRNAALLVLLAISAVAVAITSVALPRRDYPHYLLLLLPALSLVAIAAIAAVASLSLRGWRRRGAVLLVFCAAQLPSLIMLRHENRFVLNATRADGALLTGDMASPRSLAWLRPTPADTMICWGWRPECHMDSAVKSGTRDATSENQLYDTELRPYFRSRFIADLEKSRPDFVIDFVAPDSFGFSDLTKQAIRAFPDFDRLVAANFDLMSRVDPVEHCPRLYVRKTRSAVLSRSLVAFADVTGPSEGHAVPRSVDDRSTFETCGDYWLLPKGVTGTLTITFTGPSMVKSIAILNTANGAAGDRATGRLRLSLLDADRTVAVRDVMLKRFPRWTDIDLLVPHSATVLKLDVLSWIGQGGGLNEVKVYAD